MVFFGKALTALVALLHIGFFVLEYFLIKTPTGVKILRLQADHLESVTVWAQNQAVYNLMLAAGLIWTLVGPASESVGLLRDFLLVFIIVVGLYGGWSVSTKVYFMQALPAFLALVVSRFS